MNPSTPIWLTLSLVVVSLGLVLINGFFVAAEFAIVRVRRTRMEELAGQGIARAKLSIRMIDRLDHYISATQLGITVASLSLGWVGAEAFQGLLRLIFPSFFLGAKGVLNLVAVGLSFFLITLLHMVLGEIVPKCLAIQNAEKIALRTSVPLRAFYLLSRPFLRFFVWIANAILHVIGYHGLEEPPLSEQELKLVMRESREDGVISDSEAQIITRAFEFSDKRAIDIMVGREKVDFVLLNRPLEDNLAAVRNNMHTRFPVCDGDFNHVVGVAHMKDVWPLLLQRISNEAFQKSCRPPMLVDASLRQDQLLKLFQSSRGHLAVVRDPHSGENLGIVTLEDVLEELVGDIRDEHGN